MTFFRELSDSGSGFFTLDNVVHFLHTGQQLIDPLLKLPSR